MCVWLGLSGACAAGARRAGARVLDFECVCGGPGVTRHQRHISVTHHMLSLPYTIYQSERQKYSGHGEATHDYYTTTTHMLTH